MYEHRRSSPPLGFDLIRALIVSQSLTQGIKVVVRRDRPTGECCAFPSGHASAAFTKASVLERHLGYRKAWPILVIAGYVATSRLSDNRHFLSDVLFGAARAFLSRASEQRASRHGACPHDCRLHASDHRQLVESLPLERER